MRNSVFGKFFVVAPPNKNKFNPSKKDNHNANARRKAEALKEKLELEKELKEDW